MHIIIWEFLVRKGCEEEFEKVYSESGAWVRLFNKHEGYLGTNLLKDADKELTYITIDKWNSKREFDGFKRKSTKEYSIIDKKCENLTEKETHIGSFDSD